MKDAKDFRKITIRKISVRLLPFLTAAYFLASLDRVNVGFAALQMNAELGIDAQAYGFGAGLFFVSYCLFALPGSLLMNRFGVRKWLAISMLSWGIASTCMAIVQGPISFIVLRFLLGMAEASFFPTIIFYFTQWFPQNYRSRVVTVLMMAVPLSSVLGSPLSAGIMMLDNLMNLKGWHWLFIIEGSPAIFMGIWAFYFLPENVVSASFLDEKEKAWLTGEISQGVENRESAEKGSLLNLFYDKKIWMLAFIYIGGNSVTNALSLWQPQIIKSYDLSIIQTGMLNSVPFALAALAALAMYFWASHADKSNEHKYHLLIPLSFSSIALVSTTFIDQLLPLIIILCIAISAASTIKGPFWALTSKMISGRNSGQAIAAINALNSLGVFAATYTIGAVKTLTGNFTYAMLPIAAIGVIACLSTLIIHKVSLHKAANKAVVK